MKANKNDVRDGFVSDILTCFIIDLQQCSWLVHGSFLPLLKSSLKDPTDLSSYRAIAGSSLILKVFELVGDKLWGHLLNNASWRFGFKANTSNTNCT